MHATLQWIINYLVFITCLTIAADIKMRTRPKIERSNEYKIKRLILRQYDRTTRPVKHDSTTTNVNIALSLYHILDTNEKEQTFTSLLAIRQRWRDEYLSWNASKFGGVSTIRVPANQIWTPDLVISNFAGDKFNDYMVTNTIVNSKGDVLWLYPALIKTYCTLNVKYFPFDSQNCEIVFISWTHDGYQLDIIYNSSFPNSVYYKPENQEWAVDSISAQRHEKYYACCKEPYPDVTFTIHMRRGSLFYIINLIAPCFLIFLISFLGFFLPVESGEKVNLETTILLALVVFLLMVGETMPPTPDAIPVLGMFFGLTMVMVTIALVMAVIVTNIYAKRDSSQECPQFFVRLAIRFYPEVAMPPRPRADSLCGMNFAEERRFHSSHGSKHDCNGRQSEIRTIGMGDDETDSLACCCCCRGKELHGPHYKTQEALDRIDAEWRLVSKFADRVFFWLFVVISGAVQTLLFIQMVPSSNDSYTTPDAG